MKNLTVKKILFSMFCFCCCFVIAETDAVAAPSDTASFDVQQTLSPELPLEFTYRNDGVEIQCTKEIKNAVLYFRQYHEESDANAFGTLPAGKSIYGAYGSTFCFWVEYNDGIKSRAEIFYAQKKDALESTIGKQKLIQVFSPQHGTWKTPQILSVSAAPNTTVYYSLDGSEPQEFGQIYFKPFMIEKKGTVTLKIKAVAANGTTEETEITYRVDKKGKEHPAAIDFLTALPERETALQGKKVPYTVLAWNYLEFLLQSPVYYEISKQNKVPDRFETVHKQYRGPIFLDRSEDIFIFWSCESFAAGAVQQIFLPAKPTFSVSQKKITTKPVKLTFSDKRYSYYFTVGDLFIPAEPDGFSHRLKNGEKLFDINEGEEFHYNIRVKAFYEGVAQGEFFTDFTIDKKKPPKLEPIFTNTDAVNSAVRMQLPSVPPESDYEPVVKISPEVKKQKDGSYILDGENENTTMYRILAYYEDRAGNRGEVFQKEITVSPFSLYVDSERGQAIGNGSSSKPFAQIQQAFDFIKRKKDTAFAKKIWTIYVNGNFTIEEPIFISDKIELKGKNAIFNFKTNAGFVLDNAKVSLSNITFKRNEHEDEPRTVPVIYASNSILNMRDLDFEIKNGGTVISLLHTTALFENSTMTCSQKKYSECFLLKNAEAVIRNVQITLECNSAVALNCIDSLCDLTNCTITITSAIACRALECVRTNIALRNFTAVRLPDEYNTDACIFSDSNSEITKDKVTISGFKYEYKK